MKAEVDAIKHDLHCISTCIQDSYVMLYTLGNDNSTHHGYDFLLEQLVRKKMVDRSKTDASVSRGKSAEASKKGSKRMAA